MMMNGFEVDGFCISREENEKPREQRGVAARYIAAAQLILGGVWEVSFAVAPLADEICDPEMGHTATV